MKYTVIRSDTADEQIRKIIFYINENFGSEVALQKLEDLERSILQLGEHPELGMVPGYLVLKQQGYKVRGLEKNLVFYKADDERSPRVLSPEEERNRYGND